MKNSKKIRIISGEFGGRLIDTPKSELTQPMGDRERMAIFNRLRDEIPGTRVLDMFAGSGALGIEALSLGAASVDFVDKSSEAKRTIKQNLSLLKIENSDVVGEPSGKYDLIFMDPPYDNPQYELCLKIASGYLANSGYLVLSHPASPEPPVFDGLELLSDRKYAAAHIKIYQK